MQRDVFERRLLAASVCARDFARTFVEEPLPDAMRFDVHLNSSYDGNAGPEVRLFPEDSSERSALRTKDSSSFEVVDLLWRDGLVPEWVDLTVEGETGDATLVEVLACGRFSGDETTLYYTWTDHAPFGPKGPALPVGYVEGQRFSIYDRSSCRSLERLARTMQHASKIWSLALHGLVFDDEVLSRTLESSSLEILEIRGAAVLGAGLRCLARLPKLRVLRLTSGDVEALSLAALPPSARLDVLAIENLPRTVHGAGRLVAAAPNLTSLTLRGPAATTADAVVAPPLLAELHLTFPHVPTWVRPGPRLRTLSVHAPASNDCEVAGLLAEAPLELENLDLRGTPVTDALFDSLARFPGLRYLDVVDTAVTTGALERFTGVRPSLRFHPRRRATPPR